LRALPDAVDDEPMTFPLAHALRFPAVAVRHFDVLRAFVSRELKARYEGSILGRIWPVFQPLLLLGVYAAVFSGMLNVPFTRPGFPPLVRDSYLTAFFMVSGILAWTCTVEAVNRCCPVVIENANLIKKVAFPSELLPTYTVLVSFVQMLIGFALFIPFYVIVILATGQGTLAERAATLSGLAWLPVPIVLHFVFVLGLGMLLGAVNVFVRDLQQMVPLATLIWMFFSPIFYRVDTVEEQAVKAGAGWIATLMEINPLYHLLALYRGCFVCEARTHYPIESIGIFAATAAGFFLVGYGCFHRWKGQFSDEV
jgi:lipopolysaccharide transport system permease protein